MISSSIVVTRPPVEDLVQFVCAQSLDQIELLGQARPGGCMSGERRERLTQGPRRLFAYASGNLDTAYAYRPVERVSCPSGSRSP